VNRPIQQEGKVRSMSIRTYRIVRNLLLAVLILSPPVFKHSGVREEVGVLIFGAALFALIFWVNYAKPKEL
jgi:hypothetical protein